jgi:hypothetical protein
VLEGAERIGGEKRHGTKRIQRQPRRGGV